MSDRIPEFKIVTALPDGTPVSLVKVDLIGGVRWDLSWDLEWTEEYDKLSTALLRLGVLAGCGEAGWVSGLKHVGPFDFAADADLFLEEQLT